MSGSVTVIEIANLPTNKVSQTGGVAVMHLASITKRLVMSHLDWVNKHRPNM